MEKYRLTLTIANQYLAQMDEATMPAVFGNVGSLLAFQVGTQDAEILARQMGGDLLLRDLLTLPRFRAYARLLVDGMPTRPFSMETLVLVIGPLRRWRLGNVENILDRSTFQRRLTGNVEVSRAIFHAAFSIVLRDSEQNRLPRAQSLVMGMTVKLREILGNLKRLCDVINRQSVNAEFVVVENDNPHQNAFRLRARTPLSRARARMKVGHHHVTARTIRLTCRRQETVAYKSDVIRR